MVAFLKKAYPEPKTELNYKTPFQLVVAVMLSAQTTDKQVNKVAETLFKKYKTPADFANADLKTLTKEISSVSFFRNKAKAVIGAAKVVERDFKGTVPKTSASLPLLHLWQNHFGFVDESGVEWIAKRLDLVDSTDLTKISKELEALVPKKDWKYVNNGLVLYGRYVCKANKHDCGIHGLTAIYPESRSIWPKAK